MAYEEFSGELDKPTQFEEFTGTLDTVPQERGIIQRIGDFFKPEYKSVLEAQAPTPQQEQAEVNQRLSYGAGPISKETVAKADLARSGMGNVSNLQEQTVANEMTRRGAESFGDFAQRVKQLPDQRSYVEKEGAYLGSSIERGWLGLQSAVNGLRMSEYGELLDSFTSKYTPEQIASDPALQAEFDARQQGFAKLAQENSRLGQEQKRILEGPNTRPETKQMLGVGTPKRGWLDSAKAIGEAIIKDPGSVVDLALSSGPATLASAAAAAVTYLGTKNPSLAAVAGGSGSGAVEFGNEYSENRENGMSHADAWKAASLKAGVVGALDAVSMNAAGKGLNAIVDAMREGATTTALKTVGKETAKQGALGGLGEAGGSFAAGKEIDPTNVLAEVVGETVSAPIEAVSTRGALVKAMSPEQQFAAAMNQGVANTEFTSADNIARTLLNPSAYDERIVSPTQTTVLTNFTPADSPTKAAGLVDVVVPVPVGGAVNPEVEQQFGLDKLRMGATDVSTTGVATTEPAVGGVAGSDQLGGGVGVSGPSVAGAAEQLRGAASPAANAQPTVATGGQPAQQPAAVGSLPRLTERTSDADLLARVQQQTQPTQEQQPTTLKQEWYGRRGDGYLTKPDAEQALAGRQRMFPDLNWQVDQLPTGKFRLAGYETATPQETTLGTQTNQAQQAKAQQQEAPTTGVVTPESVAGEKINKEWTAFAPETGTKGIPRAEMPQIKSENRGAMVNFLNARGIKSSQDEVKANSLKPTQAEFSPEKVASAKEYTYGDRSILVSSDNYVLDGHHQWLAKLEKGEPVKVIRLGAPIDELIPAVREFPSATVAEGATNVPSPELAKLNLAPAASMRVVSSVRKSLIKENVEIAALPQSEMNDSQKIASAVARMLGKTLTVVRYESGDRASMPNGFADQLGGDNLFVADDAEDAPLFVTMHEAYHGLPHETRTKLNTALNSLFKEDMRAEFAREFNYSEDKLGEEIPAFMVQAISKRADFWEQLRAKMGNKDFAEVAKRILSKLNEIITGARKEYGNDFVTKYISDVEKARDLLTTAYAEAINNKAAAEEAKKVVPLTGPVEKTEAIIDGVMYSARSRNLVDLPTIQFKDLLGKRVFGIKADLTDAGVSYTGIDGSQLEFPVEMMGGPNFVALPENVASNVVWAVRGGATLTKIMNVVNNSDYIIVHAMNGNSHLTNATISQAYIQTVEAYLKDKRISVENLRALDKIVRSPANKNSLPDFVGFESPNIIEYIDGLSFDQRGALAKILEKKEAQIHGLPSLDRFRRETIDKEYAGYRQGDAMLVIEVDKKNPTVKLGEEGTKMHPSYPLGLRGKVVGKLEKGINYELIYRDYFENKVPTLGNKEAGAWYAFDRVLPVQEITPEIAESVSEGGYKSIKSARQAEALLALGNNSWLESGKTKATGGVSVQEFVDALAANEGAAALTMYTPAEVKAGIKDKSFSVYQLGTQGGDKGLQVFFGLKRGKPWYADMVDGISDNEVEVVSVTNNEVGAPGVGIPAIITKAIQEGATILDAYAVKSERFPDGFLPEMYAQFGFNEIGKIPFDEGKVVDKPKGMSRAEHARLTQLKMADLKAFWSANGWKESDGYPDVVVMKWSGKDEDRATAVERYVREGETGVLAGGVRFPSATATDAFGQRNRTGSGQGRTRRSDRGQAGRDQGASDAASVVGRAYTGIQELASLSAGDIRNLGLDPAAIAKLKDSVSGIQFSKRGLNESTGGPSVGRDPSGASGSVKVVGAVHYGKQSGLSMLSGASSGTGIKGAEQQRLAQPNVDPRIKRRVYFYLPVAGGIPQAEIGLGTNVYTANLSNLYDPSSGVLDVPSQPNAFESFILDSGYRGYINREQGTAVVLNSDVPVKAVGKSTEQAVVPRKGERVVAPVKTRTAGEELVRKPTNEEMTGIIKARPALAKAAPSFKLEFGEARVKASESAAADAALTDAGASFQFGGPAMSKRSIGQALQERINNNIEQVIGEYESLKGTDGGRILDTDMVRELSPEYRADRSRAAEVHDASSFLTQAMFDSRIANNNSGVVAFMAGGGGAGKSTANDLVGKKLGKAHTILDGTLSSYDKAKRNIETAINAGNKALVVYVYREPVEALRNGVLTRAERMGRTVTINALVKGHAGSSDVVRKLQDEFGDNPLFELVVVDNSRGQGNAEITSLKDITPVIQSGLKERLQNATESEFQAGRIGETVYRATTASYPDTRRGDQAGLGGEGSNGRTQGGVQGRVGSEQLQLTLTKLFTDLRGARGLKLARVQEQVENNPLSAAIKNVEENFYDIVGQLEEDGLIKINCK